MLSSAPNGYVYAFRAMATPCDVRIETSEAELARSVGEVVENEARRIEDKYSRYKADSVLSRINAAAGGAPFVLDAETTALIDYAAHCHALSGGLFDITSGVLRRVWRFDGSDRVPTRAQVAELQPYIGWDKVTWTERRLTLPKGMEIDFGGFGKEYAVDTALMKAMAITDAPLLVNFGGDLRVSGPRLNHERWRVAIESIDRGGNAEGVLDLARGALTTSGDSRRFLLKNGVRYSHILNPRTGWPVKDPPRSVSVSAPTCLEAGLLSTLAMLHGRQAERFLAREKVQAWCLR